ncbi:MAG: acyltransferase family protein [Chitinophagaceae bacterium]
MKIDIDTNRIFGLDILRALAVMFVVIAHGSYLLPVKFKEIIHFFLFDGVTIFFVLSGFLIGGILIKLIDKNGFSLQTLKGFWIRRWFRTLPNYFLILLILCIIHVIFDPGFSIRNITRYFIFSQNLYKPHPPFFPEAWSLAVEEWFYLIFPSLLFVVMYLKISFKNGLLNIAIITILLITAFRIYRFSNVEINNINDLDLLFRKQVITRLDSLMFGVVGAYLRYFHLSLWLRYKKQFLIIGILVFIVTKISFPLVPIGSFYLSVLSFTFVSIGTLMLLPYLSELKSGKGILYKPITYISLISYSMYLINLSLIQTWIINPIPWTDITENAWIRIIANYSIYWILVIVLSIIIYKYVERPTTSLRERFSK